MIYDILFCASTYKSVKSAIRFANSIKYIDGNHLCVITGPIKEEIQEIAKETNAICFISKTNSLYLGRAWGFVWAVNNDIYADYLCSCDDDIEFTSESIDIIDDLNKASDYGFSVMTFMNSANRYSKFSYSKMTKNFIIGIPWLNGDSMFTNFHDNLWYGLPDTVLSSPISYYTEIEYQHRMKAATKQPLLVVRQKNKYLHHFRTEDTAKIRAEQAGTGHVAGLQLWRKKYDLSFNTLSKQALEAAFEATKDNPNDYKHIMFGDNIEWEDVYNSLKDNYEVVNG